MLATKGRFPTDETPGGTAFPPAPGAGPARVPARRLNVETIDRYQVHGWDPLTRVEETLALPGRRRARREMARAIEWEIVPACHDARLGLLAWSPLASGWLTGQYRRREPSAVGCPWSRWRSPGVQARPAVSSVILGARTLEQFTGNLAAADLRLSAGKMQLLDEASEPPAPDYPYGEKGRSQRDRHIQGGRF